ncbi:hypothetical protein PCK2_000724 [Pneumocystis canis]|nr:hypothetical protein PCK2_000724 [Pneumocystis canis]
METSLNESPTIENENGTEQIPFESNDMQMNPSVSFQRMSLAAHSYSTSLSCYPTSSPSVVSFNDTSTDPLLKETTANIQPLNRMISTIPTRIYLNENVTPVLLEGMKIIAKESRPSNPLQVLGEYLISKSKKS